MNRIAISWRSVALVIVVTLAVQIIEYGGWLAAIDGRFFNGWLTHAKLTRKRSSQDALYLVKIDDSGYENCFSSKSPLQPDKLEAIVQTITTEAHPVVIGVDVLTDAYTYRANYRQIVAHLNQEGARSIWISGIEETALERTNFFCWLLTGKEDEFVVKPTAVLGYRPPDSIPAGVVGWGLPVYPRDEDLQVRRFPRSITLSADPEHSSVRVTVPSWSQRLAEDYCRTGVRCPVESASEIYMNFTANPPEEFALQELFDCSNQNTISKRKAGGEAFWKTAGNRIVLVGGTFQSSRDFYSTPRGLLSGLEINAYAIQSELDGNGFDAVRQPWAVLLDLTIGFLTLLVVSMSRYRRWLLFRWLIKSNEPRLSIAMSAAIWFVLVYAVWVFTSGYLMGIAGVILGVLLDPFASILKNNPSEPDEVRP